MEHRTTLSAVKYKFRNDRRAWKYTDLPVFSSAKRKLREGKRSEGKSSDYLQENQPTEGKQSSNMINDHIVIAY